MEQRHKDILRQNAVRLTSDLEVDHAFLSRLKQDKIITDNNIAHLLLSTKTNQERSDELQRMIVMKGPLAWASFIRALVETEQNDLARALDPTLGQESNSPVSNHSPPPTEGPIAQDVYPMEYSPHGRFVIINNNDFKGNHERQGSDIDVDNLHKLCKKLDFEEDFMENLTAKAIKEKVAALSSFDASKSDAFIFCIMSHGTRDVVFGVDGGAVSIEIDICQPFYGGRCRSLIGKPKVFIIQACQGDKQTTGVSQADSLEDSQEAQFTSSASDVTDELRIDIHPEADVYIAFSTVSGDVSWRNHNTGSWFIRAIVEVFNNHADKEDLKSLFTRVTDRVSEMKTKGNCVQVPFTVSTLRKKLLLKALP